MRKVAIIGAGGHAKVLIDIVKSRSDITVAGLIDLPANVGSKVLGIDVIGTDEDLPQLLSDGTIETLLIGLGNVEQRLHVFERVREILPDAPYDTAVHAAAHIGLDVHLAPGTVVMAGATINPSCRIGRHCVINTNASLDHDSLMGDFSSLGPNSATGGGVEIGTAVTVGIGASVVQGVAIADHSTVGAGSVVLSDVSKNTTVAGVPAAPIK